MGMKDINLGGYSYPPKVTPFDRNEITTYGSLYTCEHKLGNINARTVINGTQTLYNLSYATIAQYAVPVDMTPRDTYLAWTYDGAIVIDDDDIYKYTSVTPITDTLIQGGEIISTTSYNNPVIVYKNVSRETFISFYNGTGTAEQIGSILITERGAVQAYIIYNGENGTMLFQGAPVVGQYQSNRPNALLLTHMTPNNPIQLNLGRLYHIGHRALMTGGSGGEDWSEDINSLNQAVESLEQRMTAVEGVAEHNRLVIDEYQISYRVGSNTYTKIGITTIVDDLNERIIALSTNPGYDDTLIKEQIANLTTSIQQINTRLDDITITDGTTTVIASNLEGVLQWLYNYARDNAGGGGDPALAGRVTTIEDRLDTFSLSYQGEVQITDTFENVSQWVYDYTRNTLNSIGQNLLTITDRIDGHDNDIEGIAAQLDNKAPTNHASADTTYGIATETLNAHVTISPNYIGTSTTTALSQVGANALFSFIDDLSARVTALEEGGGGGGGATSLRDIIETRENTTTARNVDNIRTTGLWRCATGSGGFTGLNVNGVNYTNGWILVLNGWDYYNQSSITNAWSVVQVFYPAEKAGGSSEPTRAFMRIGDASRSAPNADAATLVWTTWQEFFPVPVVAGE